MECPKCKGCLRDIPGVPFSARKCDGCYGIWFSHGSHEIAKKIKGIAAIDDCETHAAAAYQGNGPLACPECHQMMIGMVDKDQYHIHFESCPACFGVFFDSGEFRDFAELKFRERVRQTMETFISNLRHSRTG